MYRPRKKYSNDFKENAVRLMVESGLSPTEIAKDLDIDRKMLYRWKKEIMQEGEKHLEKGKISQKDIELKRLEKEVAELKMERDILKKALGIFSKHPK